MAATARQALPYPVLGTPTPPDIPADLQALAEQIDSRLVARHASAAARSTADPAPAAGELTYRADLPGYEGYIGSVWTPQGPVSLASASARATALPSPVDGTITYQRDIGRFDGCVAGAWVALTEGPDLRDLARPGGDSAGISATVTSVSAGPAAICAAPSAGRRCVKSIVIHAPAAGMIVTLTLAGTDLVSLQFASGGIATFDVLAPFASGETFTATVAGGTACITVSYADRADSAVDRFGLISGVASGTLVASSGTARTITELWIGNASGVDASTATIAVGGSMILNALPITTRTVFTLDVPLKVPAGTAVTYATDGTHALTFMASGRI